MPINWKGAIDNIQSLVQHGSFAQRDTAMATQDEQQKLQEKAMKESEKANQEAEKAAQLAKKQTQVEELHQYKVKKEQLNILEKVAKFLQGGQPLVSANGSSTGPSPDKTAPATSKGNVVPSTPDYLKQAYLDTAASTGIPANWLSAQGAVESNFNPLATSSAGAQGIHQFMPDTLKYMKENGYPEFDPNDPKEAIKAAAWYIKDIMNRTTGGDSMNPSEGDLTAALSAYNAGTGNYKKYGGKIPFDETLNYVEKIRRMANGLE